MSKLEIMRMKNQFKLTNVTLYAKGWYEISENLFSDLIKMLELDNYTPFSRNDVVFIILNNYQKAFDVELVSFIDSINETNCWKVGYYTNNCDWVQNYESLPKYDVHTACIYKVLSDLRFITKEKWIPKFPKYNKTNPKPKKITICNLYEFFARKNFEPTSSTI